MSHVHKDPESLFHAILYHETKSCRSICWLVSQSISQ